MNTGDDLTPDLKVGAKLFVMLTFSNIELRELKCTDEIIVIFFVAK
jgi:hypothetical protein